MDNPDTQGTLGIRHRTEDKQSKENNTRNLREEQN
jgi:hypothetical protein